MRRQANLLLAVDLAWWVPTPILFEDRDDGTLYMLTHDTAEDEVSITSTIPSRVAGATAEPQLEGNGVYIRLYVDEGELRYEVVDDGEELDGPPVFSLNTSDLTTTYEVYASCVAVLGDPIGLKKYTGLGSADVTVTDLGCVQFIVSGGEVFEDGVFVEGVFV